nr:hypothetical protein [Bacillus mycoides]
MVKNKKLVENTITFGANPVFAISRVLIILRITVAIMKVYL